VLRFCSAQQYRVAILTKRAVREGSSGWAQGGIAAVWDKDDSFAAHVDDTLIAGAGLCDLEATQFVVENAPSPSPGCKSWACRFSEEAGHAGQLHLTREGGHSAAAHRPRHRCHRRRRAADPD